MLPLSALYYPWSLNYSNIYSNLLTYCMDQSPSWAANRFSATQKIPHILWNPKIHYCIHKCPTRKLFLQMILTGYFFYGEELLAPRPTPKLEDHPLSAICDYLFNIFAATLYIVGPSSIRKLRTRHAVVTGTHLSHMDIYSNSTIKSTQAYWN